MYRSLKLAVATVVAVQTASVAQAAQYVFVLTGSHSATFNIDKPAVPSQLTGTEAVFTNISGIFDGMALTASSITFGTTADRPSLEITAPSFSFSDVFGSAFLDQVGSVILFNQGVYASAGMPQVGNSLTITDVDGGGGQTPPGGGGGVSAVPEPATWLTLIGGFAIVGALQRTRRRPVALA